MKAASSPWLLLLFTQINFLSSYSRGLPLLDVRNVTSCQTYVVSWDNGIPPFFIRALSTAPGQGMWSVSNIAERNGEFPIFFSPGTTVDLAVFDSTNFVQLQLVFDVVGTANNTNCATSYTVTNATLASNLTAVGPCDTTNLQWQGSTEAESVAAIETLNLVQNVNHTFLDVNGTGISTQIRLPVGVEYRLTVGADLLQYPAAVSEPLVVQSSNNTSCLIGNFHPTIDNSVPITNATTAAPPNLTTPAPSDSNFSVDVGLGLGIPLVALSCAYVCLILARKRKQHRANPLPLPGSTTGLTAQLTDLMRDSRGEVEAEEEEGYHERVFQAPYLVATARVDPDAELDPSRNWT